MSLPQSSPSYVDEDQGSLVPKPVTITDALGYLDRVRDQFWQDRPEQYNRFLDVMKDFRTQVIDTPNVVKRIYALFRGYPDLIEGFNVFLPPGYRIDSEGQDAWFTTPEGERMQASEESLSFVEDGKQQPVDDIDKESFEDDKAPAVEAH